MSYDEMELDKIGDRKTALFLIMSDTDTTFNFVIAMLQSQLFNLLCHKADDEYGGKVGYEIPFTRYFYKYEAPRPSAEIMAEIMDLETELSGSLEEVFDL